MPQTPDHYRGLHLDLRLLRILVAVLGILSPFFLTALGNLGRSWRPTAGASPPVPRPILVILTRGIDLSVELYVRLGLGRGCPRLHEQRLGCSRRVSPPPAC